MVRGVLSLLSLVALVAIIVTPRGTESAITCGTVVTGISPCLVYVEGRGPLTPGCCNSIRSLFATAAKTTRDLQTACNCLKAVARGTRGLDLGLVAGVPAKCGVNIPFPIKLSTDCSKLKAT